MQKTGLIYLSMDMIGHKILFKVRHYKELPQLITYIKTQYAFTPSVCHQDYTKNTHQISMKLGLDMGLSIA